jgi:hypothetical protein
VKLNPTPSGDDAGGPIVKKMTEAMLLVAVLVFAGAALAECKRPDLPILFDGWTATGKERHAYSEAHVSYRSAEARYTDCLRRIGSYSETVHRELTIRNGVHSIDYRVQDLIYRSRGDPNFKPEDNAEINQLRTRQKELRATCPTKSC